MLQLYNPTNLSKILLSCHFSMSPLWLLVAHALYLSVCVSKENYFSKIYPKFIRSYPLMIIEKTITQISNKWFSVSLERFVPFYCAFYRIVWFYADELPPANLLILQIDQGSSTTTHTASTKSDFLRDPATQPLGFYTWPWLIRYYPSSKIWSRTRHKY